MGISKQQIVKGLGFIVLAISIYTLSSGVVYFRYLEEFVASFASLMALGMTLVMTMSMLINNVESYGKQYGH